MCPKRLEYFAVGLSYCSDFSKNSFIIKNKVILAAIHPQTVVTSKN